MKNILSILTLALIVSSCGGDESKKQTVESIIAKGDLTAMRAKKEAIKQNIAELNTQIESLDAVLAKNDTVKKEALVTAMTIKDTLFTHFVEVQGNVETKQNVLIYPEYSGTLSRVLVKEGQRVSKGQTLARIDDGGLSSQVAQLESQEALAKTTFERQKRLWDQKIGSEIQYLQTKTQYESAKNAVTQLKSQLGKTSVKAPFSGIIDNVITEQGTVVAPGQAIFRIVNLRDMYVSANIPERYLGTITKGKQVKVDLPVQGKTFDSKVRQTGNYINPTNRNFMIEVNVPNKDGNVKPNLTARLSINDYTAENAILIPLDVINEDGEGNQYVYTASAKANSQSATAMRQIIKTGQSQGNLIEILEGLKDGDQIIVEGARSVKDGQEVRILND